MANPREDRPVLHTRKHIARLERERQQTRLILIAFIAILVSVIGLILYAVLYPKYIQPKVVIAKVGGTSLTAGEWQARVRMERGRLINQAILYQKYAQYFGLDTSAQLQQIAAQLGSTTNLGQTVLDRMIDEELIRQEAAKRGLTASKEEVDQVIQASYRYFPNGTQTPTITPTPISFPTLSADTLALVTITPTGTPLQTPTPAPSSTPDVSASPTATIPPTATATFGPTPTITPTSTLEPTATPYTQQGFEDAYKQGVDSLVAFGMTAEWVRQLYETNVLRDKLYNPITADVPRTQEQVWARHILVADEATAKAVRQRLLNGEDFATVAKELSTDTGSAKNGGDLGWFPKKADALPGQITMVAEFEAAAFSLKTGEISQPVKSQFGYHIIQVLAHAQVPLDASAYEQARQTAFSDWLKKAREEYKVVTYNNWQTIVPTDPAMPSTIQ